MDMLVLMMIMDMYMGAHANGGAPAHVRCTGNHLHASASRPTALHPKVQGDHHTPKARTVRMESYCLGLVVVPWGSRFNSCFFPNTAFLAGPVQV